MHSPENLIVFSCKSKHSMETGSGLGIATTEASSRNRLGETTLLSTRYRIIRV